MVGARETRADRSAGCEHEQGAGMAYAVAGDDGRGISCDVGCGACGAGGEASLERNSLMIKNIGRKVIPVDIFCGSSHEDFYI